MIYLRLQIVKMKLPYDNDMSLFHSRWYEKWPPATSYMSGSNDVHDFTIEAHFPWVKKIQMPIEVEWEGYSEATVWFRRFWLLAFIIPVAAYWMNKVLVKGVKKPMNLDKYLIGINLFACVLFALIAWQFWAHLFLGFRLNGSPDYQVCRAGSAQFNKSSSGLWVIGYATTKVILLFVDLGVAALRQRMVLDSYMAMQAMEVVGLWFGVAYEASRIVVVIALFATLDAVNYFCLFWELIRSAPKIARQVLQFRIFNAFIVISCESLHLLRAGANNCDNTASLGLYLIVIFTAYLGLSSYLYLARFGFPKESPHSNHRSRKTK